MAHPNISPSSELRTEAKSSKPLGIRFLENAKNAVLSFRTYQTIVLILTFIAYSTYHVTRKTTSIVKTVFDPEQPQQLVFSPWSNSYLHTTTKDGWAPFNTRDGTAMLGMIDVAFLAVYSFGMYLAGHLGDRLDLRVVLTVGMIGTGVFTSLFGIGYWLNIHNFYYYLVIQMLAGLFQSSGWPSVVAVMGNWLGKRKRGLIMGIWNAHTSVGNISGSLIASFMLRFGWGWSFAVPGILIVFVAVVVFLLLPVSPEIVGVGEEEVSVGKEKRESTKPLLESREEVRERAVGFIEAWRIPGVAPFALCLFFSKLVAYTFLYWLPFYISHTAIDNQYLSDSTAGTLSTLFDAGGVVGGILAATSLIALTPVQITAASFTYCAIPALFLYRIYGDVSLSWNIVLMFIAGMFVNGPYALITTAVSTDLGSHGDSRALATVTAIIDGTGSVGAAVGPLLTVVYISGEYGMGCL
ncbi:uncharacterized protein A4U43_C08F2090 [Asparagus officinalis]|nr:uncharacterized protein A4U43_C08F2090 [Asparagus officinalis]